MNAENLLIHNRRQILQIAEKHGANNVRLFGSPVRGEGDDASDIDLLVTFEEGRSLFDHASLILELNDNLGCQVDVFSDQGIKPLIQQRVLDEAIPR
jgi:uncharacterized protein